MNRPASNYPAPGKAGIALCLRIEHHCPGLPEPGLGSKHVMKAILANVAVPMFFPQPLLALIALLPIVGVETAILRRAGKVSVRDVFIANVFSAIWGVPLAFISVMVLGYSSGMALGDNTRLLDIGLVMLVLIVPCLILSVYLEGWYLRPRVSGMSGRPFWFAVARAQCYSYLVLLVVYCLWITIQLRNA